MKLRREAETGFRAAALQAKTSTSIRIDDGTHTELPADEPGPSDLGRDSVPQSDIVSKASAGFWSVGFGLTRRDWRLAACDLVNGFRAWHLWTLLGILDIRQRYKRSRLGQFWITLSMGGFIGGIGLVYSTLFNVTARDYIPYLTVTVTVWTLISGAIGESTTIFAQNSVFLRQESIPKTVFILRLLVRSLVILGHNLAIVPIAFIVFSYRPSAAIVLAIPGLVILVAVLFMATLIIGLLSARFRDAPQIIQNGLQLLFFVTPVMWRADQMAGPRQGLLVLNPFASLLRIVSDPILGHVPPPAVYLATLASLAVLSALAMTLFARSRARVVYWL